MTATPTLPRTSRSIWNRGLFPLLVLGSSVLVACQQTPLAPKTPLPEPRVLRALELPMGDAQPLAQAVLPDSSGSFTPTGAVSVCDYLPFNARYISRSFRFTNLSATTLTNTILHAYHQTSNADGTALKGIVDFGGSSTPAPRNAIPTHGMDCANLMVNSSRADLQLFDEATTSARTNEALSATPALLQNGEYLLQYGFALQQRGGDTDSDGDPRTVAPNETANVTVAMEVPRETSSAYRFSMTFLITPGNDRELVQSSEEQLAGTVAGLSSLPNATRKVTVVGGQACGDTSANLKFITGYRTAGKIGGTGPDAPNTLYSAPAPSVTVTSSNSSGAGSLRDAIANAAPGTALCFTNSITLAAELLIDKQLFLYGGNNVALDGDSTTRVLSVSGGNTMTVGLAGFTLQNGRVKNTNAVINLGGGLLNNGRLTLIGVKVTGNGAFGYVFPNTGLSGALYVARGAGIANSGTLTLANSLVTNNQAFGSNAASATVPTGFPGVVGGGAFGAGIYNTGTLTITKTRVTQNTAFGGMGGNALGIATPVPPVTCITPQAIGGQGGDASGGGIYSMTALDASAADISGDSVVAGPPGNAFGPPPCPVGPNLSASATNPNLRVP
jgi:hypothetical protein